MNLVLYGSGEFTAAVNDIDRYLIDKYGIKNIAVIPTAAGKEKDVTKWFTRAEQHFKDLDISVIKVPVFNTHDANNSSVVKLLDNADWIFFSGGNPNYLLKTLEGTLLWNKVIEQYKKEVLLAGSSAGAMIMGTYMLAHPFKSILISGNTSWKKAFGLINYRIFPHFDRFKNHKFLMQRLVKQNKENNQSSWLGIDENTAILFNDEQELILGKGSVEIQAKD
jgi:cyanophycinase